MSQGTTIESLPICLGGKGFKVLIGAAVQGRVGGPQDSAEIEESLFIDPVILEELSVVPKIAEKPVEPPESSVRTVHAAGEGSSFERLGFQNSELEFHKRLLWMPPVPGPLHTNKK